ncbi:MAG TPA: hypothetical protein VK501_10535 [Baekduia sp.]|uniref:hypothetical protein n=1 Tax=Baekduia sp. TaxID=2600305 RepID=UPI002BB0BB2E|nr:hypothetical protein [Baekduia sp.]HMJ34345.1 hypothetical protein [Baekduia sp.]
MKARRIRATFAAAVGLAGLAGGLALGESAAQDAATGPSVPSDQGVLVAPRTVPPDPHVPPGATATAQDPPPTTTTETVTIPQVTGPPITTTTTATSVVPWPVTGAGVGNAALQGYDQKRHEAARSCDAKPEATSGLLGVDSSVSGRDHRLWTWIILAITATAAAIALVAFLARRRRTAAAGARKTSLELVAASVAIAGTLAGLASTFIPGVGVRDHPPPQVSMEVREVHARVTHGAYDDALGPRHGATRVVGATTASAAVAQLSPEARRRRRERAAKSAALDRLEIGHVVWLELQFTGYRGRKLRLQWGLFGPGAGSSLIPGTERYIGLDVDDGSDVHSKFLPIWLGTPRRERFRAEFRLLDHGEVRQMARTGDMRGVTFRYACRPPRRG